MSTATHTAEAHKGQPADTSTHKRKRKSPDASQEVVERTYGLQDIELFDCPICFEPLASPPIYQCQNGRTACSACCEKLQGKGCPTCSLPTGSIRCISLEKILGSLGVSCKYARYD